MTHEGTLLESVKSRADFLKQVATIESGFFVVILFIVGLIQEITSGDGALVSAMALSVFPVLTLIFSLFGLVLCSDTIELLDSDRLKRKRYLSLVKIFSIMVILLFIASKLFTVFLIVRITKIFP